MIKQSLLLVIRNIEEEIDTRWGREALFMGPFSENLKKTDPDYRNLQRMLDYYLNMLRQENWKKTRKFRQILRKNEFDEALHCLKFFSWDIEDGIYPLVLELNRSGIETLESCEGHFGDTWSSFRAPSIFPWVYVKNESDVLKLKKMFSSLMKGRKVTFMNTIVVLNVVGADEREDLIQKLTTLLRSNN